jgi:hypothetical protein
MYGDIIVVPLCEMCEQGVPGMVTCRSCRKSRCGQCLQNGQPICRECRQLLNHTPSPPGSPRRLSSSALPADEVATCKTCRAVLIDGGNSLVGCESCGEFAYCDFCAQQQRSTGNRLFCTNVECKAPFYFRPVVPVPAYVPASASFRSREHWAPDNTHMDCSAFSCGKPFNFVRRRHHCRKCGRIFCGNCAPVRKSAGVRLCGQCA